ncbi:pentapeptide repeat-containing protein [Nostoc punctiforme]|uniref:Pentapeptide repeat protein n=1 Tax=Nostoc punctiforme (strain ATCC 29133 / PCC 73102) TaxID=63737 RepID=B2IWA6_NOSP7|nr:pentapeptide repeat-containing protein [Nostoc punctiforme]ACC79851.1 pentapeptide repeat protein [Nostoc punctiforme PCC 73102]
MQLEHIGQNLQGRSFKGQNLTGANFKGADIRGADFTDANLRNANFFQAKAGLQNHWLLILLITLFLIGALSLFTAGVVAVFAGSKLLPASHLIGQYLILFINPILLTIFLIVAIYQGLNKALITIVFLAVFSCITLIYFQYYEAAAAFAGNLLWLFTVGITGAIIFTSVIILTKYYFWILIGAGFIAWVVSTVIPLILGQPHLIVFKVAFSSAIGVSISIYASQQAIMGMPQLAWLHSIAIAFTTISGTRFSGADLTDADFTGATLKNTDFRKANLTRTRFHNAKKLDQVRSDSTYLEQAKLIKVLVTGQGREQNFDRQDLRGINLQGANLVDASFIGADLSLANLQDTDLSRAKLVQTQLDGTDFTGATLTGAYIEDWGITSDTKFDGVRCEYVYMRLPTKENPDPFRKPDNYKEVFAPGEFGDFIQPIFDTLDLYHNQGVDPRAIAISFKRLAQNHPDAELEIVAMEKRGQDKFLLRAKTAATADKSELSAEYFDTYNEIKGLPEREIKLLLAEKDNQIRRLENMVMTALERPSFYSNIQVEEVDTMTNNPGGFSIGGSVGGNVHNVQGDNNRAVQGDNDRAVLGDNNQVTQQNQVGADATESLTKEDVVKLLAQLETLIKGAELPADTKEEVIEDLSAAKKATDKEEPNKQRALERLGTVAETLDKTSKGVEAGQKVWTIAKPIIVKVATWLGVAAGSHLLGL